MVNINEKVFSKTYNCDSLYFRTHKDKKSVIVNKEILIHLVCNGYKFEIFDDSDRDITIITEYEHDDLVGLYGIEKKDSKMKNETVKKTKKQIVNGVRRAALSKITEQVLDHIKSKTQSDGANKFIDSPIGQMIIPLVAYKAIEVATEGQATDIYVKLNKIATAGSEEYTQQVIDGLLPDMSTIINIVGLISSDLLDDDKE